MKPTNLSVSFEAFQAPPCVFNHSKTGLSDHIYFVIRNHGDEPVTLTFPGHKRRRWTRFKRQYSDTYFHIADALREDFLQLQKGEDRAHVPVDDLDLNDAADSDSEDLNDTAYSEAAEIAIRPGAKSTHLLLRRSSFQMSRIGLPVPERYYLGFANRSPLVKCKVGTPNEVCEGERATPSPADQYGFTNLEWIGDPIQIDMGEHIPVPHFTLPRFSASFRFSSSTCNLSGSPPFSLIISLKSLEPTPVFLCTAEVPCVGGLDEILTLWDVATGEEIDIYHVSCTMMGESGSVNDPMRESQFAEFREGAEYTREKLFGEDDLHDLQPNRTYKAKMHAVGFAWWYTADDKATFPMGMNEKGCIKAETVEAAPTIAGAIQRIIESGSTGYFHRLPRELRDMIYEKLEKCEPGVLYFRTEAAS